MSKGRRKTGLVHLKNKVEHEVRQDRTTDKFYIINTDIEVPSNRLKRKTNPGAHKRNYDFDKPYQAQDLGDEWSDYAWGGNDF
jgi:hypothetical protein